MAAESERSGGVRRESAARSVHRRERLAIAAVSIAIIALGGALVHRAQSKVNRIALAAAPRPVSVVEAQPEPYCGSREYVGAVESWVEASVGPQFISAYVSTVVVRPGDVVRRGQVLATLDCAHPTATSRSVEMQAQAIDERQRALADEAARERSMLGGGFIAPNQVEQSAAQSSSEKARLQGTKAQLRATALEVRDCALRAPFDGEIATRSVDPGAFVHPGVTIVSVVDRHAVRVVVDAPETDFDRVDAGVPVRIEMLSTGASVEAAISRRAPKAAPSTRTIRFEVDVVDPHRAYPTGTTAIVHLDLGQPVPAVRIPLDAATQHEGKAKVFSVQANRARLLTLPVLGERGGDLYLSPKVLPAHTRIVTDGRALISDGEEIDPHLETARAPADPDGGTRGGGFGRPL